MKPSARLAASGSLARSWPSIATRPDAGLEQSRDHADRGGLAGAVRAQEAVDLAGLHFEAHAVDGAERAERLHQRLDQDHLCLRGGCDQQPPASRRGSGRSSGRRSAVSRPTSTGTAPGRSSTSRMSSLARPIRPTIAAWRSRPPRASRTCVASAGNWLRVGSTGSQRPRPGASADPDLGPGVVVEGAAQVHEPDRDARRQAQRAGHRDVEGRVLVAVADPGPEHLEGRGKAHGRPLLDDGVDVAGEPLGAKPGCRGARRGLLGLGADLRGVALQEHLGAPVPLEVARGRARLEIACVRHLDRRAVARLAGARKIGRVEPAQAVDPQAEPCDAARVVDAPGAHGHERARLEHVGLDRARDGERLRLLPRLAHHLQAHRAFLAHHLADVGDPRPRCVTPARRSSTRKAGTGRPAARTSSRACTSTVIGVLRSVKGSKTATTCVCPGSRPRAASARGRLSARAGASASWRVSCALARGVADHELEAQALERAHRCASRPYRGRARTRSSAARRFDRPARGSSCAQPSWRRPGSSAAGRPR